MIVLTLPFKVERVLSSTVAASGFKNPKIGVFIKIYLFQPKLPLIPHDNSNLLFSIEVCITSNIGNLIIFNDTAFRKRLVKKIDMRKVRQWNLHPSRPPPPEAISRQGSEARDRVVTFVGVRLASVITGLAVVSCSALSVSWRYWIQRILSPSQTLVKYLRPVAALGSSKI